MKVLSLFVIAAFAMACIEGAHYRKGGKAAPPAKPAKPAKAATTSTSSTTKEPPKLSAREEKLAQRKADKLKNRKEMSAKKKEQQESTSSSKDVEDVLGDNASVGADAGKPAKAVWQMEAEALDHLWNMYIIKQGPSAEYPEKTYAKYYAEMFADLKTKINIEELDKWAMEDFERQMNASKNATTQSTSTISPAPAPSSGEKNSTTTIANGNSSKNVSNTTTTTATNSNSSNNNSSNNSKKNNKKQAAPVSTAQANARLSSSSSNSSSASTSTASSTSSVASILSSNDSSSDSSRNSSPSTPSTPVSQLSPASSMSSLPQSQPKAAKEPAKEPVKEVKEEQPAIKENYLPVYFSAYADTKMRDQCARYLDPLVRGDLSVRSLPTTFTSPQKNVLKFYDQLFRAMGPERPETRDFIRAEFTYASDVKPVEFAENRMATYTSIVKGFTQNIREHLEGIPRAEHERMCQIASALSELHNNAFKPLKGSSYDAMTSAHNEFARCAESKAYRLADEVMSIVAKFGEGRVAELESAPNNVVDEIATIELPDGIKTCFTALDQRDAFSLLDMTDAARQILPETTEITALPDTLRQKSEETVEVFLNFVKEASYSSEVPANYDIIRTTMIDWLIGWMAAAAVGKPHLNPSADQYDLDYYKSFLAAIKSSAKPLNTVMSEALRLKLIGDAKANVFVAIHQNGGLFENANDVTAQLENLHAFDQEVKSMAEQMK